MREKIEDYLYNNRKNIEFLFLILALLFVLSFFVVAVVSNRNRVYNGIIVDKVYREHYITTQTTTNCYKTGSITVCKPETTVETHPDQWYFELKQCDTYNNCSYNTQYVDKNIYNQYETGEYYPKGQ